VPLNDLVQQVVEVTRARWSDIPHMRGVVIDTRTDLTRNLPVIMGVENEIRDALTNLVFNAVDAMSDGGALTLRTRTGEFGRVIVEVSDTGVGMDETTRRRCLEPFFTTKGERGTGLGLAMVYGMVQRHSADMDIESVVGRGTTVSLSFAAAVSAAPSEAVTEHVVPTGLRILVVDDDPLLLRSLRETLESDGHVIETASGGREGIDRFREAKEEGRVFNVVLTDLGMPFVDGRQVATAIKACSPATPIIMLTGWGQRLVAEGDMPAHVNIVLSKPPKLRDLREALGKSCASANG
jgi:CheY-like chemotaxis protein/anti-sigma regulatory factor (Ser/Thr protein kinase)